MHAKGKPIAEGIDLMAFARRTPGFTGADLANVLNEAALLTARNDKKLIDADALDEAIDRVVAGPQKRTRIMSDKEKKITAYHEGGHALVAAALPNTDPVHKITILSRGRALGYTMVLPDEDKYSTTRNEMLDQLAYMLGGRAAEEIVFHDPTTGAANDIEKATSVARAMVTQYGMTERIGAIKLGSENAEPFLGRDMGHQRDYSEEVAGVVDEEVKRLIETAHDEAWEILVDNRDILDDLVLELLEKETLDKAAGRRGLHPHPQAAGRARPGPARPSAARRPARCMTPKELASPKAANGQDKEHSMGATGPTDVPDSPAAVRRRPRAAAGVRGLTRGRSTASTRPATRRDLRPRGRAPGRPRPARRHRRGPRPRRAARHPGRGWPGPTTRSSPGCGRSPRTCSRRPSTSATTRWCWSRTSRCGRCASTTWCRSSASRTSATSRPRDGRITGLSKLARLVDVFARRPQVQERLTTQIADSLMRILEPRGAIVVIECEHLCMSMRGIRKPGATTVTSAVRGQLRDPTTRAEAMSLIVARR